MSYLDLRPEQALAALQEDPALRVLDVRTPPEHDRLRIVNSILLPVQEIRSRWAELDPGERYLVVCEHGIRSAFACEFLASQGFEELRNLRGGLAQWVGRGLPVEKRA
jgi:rhodanese-related sulfurtransferase